ncbi:MAG: hypothetical protein HQ510_12680 [Candidatus Marinimicrobia bacterium]|nr:hypothetical protein [Candidatus Neomarinimicrobiota bacterium]
MITQLFTSDSGVVIFPLISLFIFLGIFTTVIIWVARMKKPYLDKMSHLPIEKSRYSQEETNRG